MSCRSGVHLLASAGHYNEARAYLNEDIQISPPALFQNALLGRRLPVRSGIRR